MINTYKRGMYKLVNWSIYLIFFLFGFIMGVSKYGELIKNIFEK